jgi:uncharacterized membrane protein YbhN (UPF0104 family)
MGSEAEPRDDGLVVRLTPRVIRQPRRVFASSPGMPRSRRASDVVVLVPALLVLAALIVAYPPSRLERSLAAFLAAAPGWLDPLWAMAYDFLALWAIALVLVAVVSRRRVVTLQVLASVVVAGLVALVSDRLATDRWAGVDAFRGLETDDATFVVVRVALCAATILAVVPHLVRPLQRFSRWTLAVGVVGALLAEPSAPGATLAALAAGVAAAAAIRLASGTSAGYPEPDDVVASLAELGVEATSLEPAARQPAGLFVARGEDAAGRPLLVKVYGRDAYDTQLVEKLRRTAWYRCSGPRLRLSRLQAVEQEALVTLLARQAGVATSEVVAVGESSTGDALLVVRDESRGLGHLAAGELGDELLAQAWEAIERLGGAGIAHQRVDATTLVVRDGTAGVVDFQAAALVARPEQLLTDRAQLLAATAALVGAPRAVGAAVAAVGTDGVGALLPYLQAGAFASPLRRSLEDAGIDADELRREAAAAAGVETPPLVQLRRVTWWTLAQTLLLVLAAATILRAIVGLDLTEVASYLENASWWWLAVAFVAAQLPRMTQALSTIGSVPANVPYGPTYVMQLATGYMNVALPSHFARLALSIRFFQRLGVPPATAVTSGAIDSFTGTVVQLALLGLLLLFSSATLGLDLDTPDGDSVRLVAVLAFLVVLAAAAVLLLRRIRRAIADRVRRWWPDVRDAVLGLRSSNKLGLLLGGNVATEVLFATALGLFANALGYDIALTELLLINISTSLLASFVPVPGGIGVAEFGLTVGLTAAGMPEEAALTTALLYRAATFYVPPLWGFFAFRWLQRNDFL